MSAFGGAMSLQEHENFKTLISNFNSAKAARSLQAIKQMSRELRYEVQEIIEAQRPSTSRQIK